MKKVAYGNNLELLEQELRESPIVRVALWVGGGGGGGGVGAL